MAPIAFTLSQSGGECIFIHTLMIFGDTGSCNNELFLKRFTLALCLLVCSWYCWIPKKINQFRLLIYFIIVRLIEVRLLKLIYIHVLIFRVVSTVKSFTSSSLSVGAFYAWPLGVQLLLIISLVCLRWLKLSTRVNSPLHSRKKAS